jgi:hypothetical protein
MSAGRQQGRKMDSSGFNLIAGASLPISRLLDVWSRVGDLADYFGEISSPRRADPLLHSNMYSTVLNELLELCVVIGKPTGCVDLSLSYDGEVDRINLRVDCDGTKSAMVVNAVNGLGRENAKAAFLLALKEPGTAHPCLGLYELMADYSAHILTVSGEGSLTLRVDVCLKGIQA